MKVIFHPDFYQVYSDDPASEQGRMEAVMDVIESGVELVTAVPATEEDIAAVHTKEHIKSVRQDGLYPIASLAAGGAIQAAVFGLNEPCFGLIRPPGHHASTASSWGFCYFNNMAIAIGFLKRKKRIQRACILDIDLHYGDGTVDALGDCEYVTIYNSATQDRERCLNEITREMENCRADIIGISAGFDNHEDDWGGVYKTEDYYEIGKKVRKAALRCGGGCFGILEGGYNHKVLGNNVLALIKGLSEI